MPRCVRRARVPKLAFHQPVLARCVRHARARGTVTLQRAALEGGMCAEVELRWEI